MTRQYCKQASGLVQANREYNQPIGGRGRRSWPTGCSEFKKKARFVLRSTERRSD